jgi:putative CocE/NonD family hydrolase
MSEPSTDAVRPSWRQRFADRMVGRAIKVPGAGSAYKQLTTAAPMRDGASLIADVYQPANAKATVLIRSPYGREFPLSTLHARVFARHGYQVVVQSVRGRTGSTGEFRPAVNEGTDGQDTVAWLRKQDWYTGRLATFGGSYLGLAQWALLTEPPEECGASVVVVGPHDFSRAAWGSGAFALADMFGWSQAMTAPEGGGLLRQAARMRGMHRRAVEVMGRLPVLAACESALGDGAPWFHDWISHANTTDAFWDSYRLGDALKNSEVPTLLIGGWRDAFIDQTLEQYDALRSRGVDVALTVGPWTHMQTATKAAGEVTREAMEWFDYCFADGARRPGRVRAVVTGTDAWQTLDDWPPQTSSLELHLAPERLVEGTADHGQTTFVFDPADPTPALGGRSTDPTASGVTDNRTLAKRTDVIAFTGDALPSPVEICGTPELELRLTAANSHADVFVRLCDVDPKGRALNIADAFVRLDPGIPAGEEQHLRMTLDPCWHQVQAGHRLQLLVAGGAHPRFARNLGTPDSLTESSELAIQPRTIHHDGTTLRLPVVATG